MASYNRVVLMGNLTRDPEIRYLPSHMAVSDIGLAVNDRRKDSNGNWVDETTFVDITLWGRNAEVAAEYARKGTPILIEGRLKLDSWDVDGQKRSKLKVVGERLCLLGGRNSAPSNDGYTQQRQGSPAAPPQGNPAPSNYGGGSSYDVSHDVPSTSGGDDIPF